ncbi:MAG: hypothetical protein ACREC1_10585, partial [Methylovirgula sp.]
QKESIEPARQTAKTGRDAWQELAKVAAELMRADAQVRKEASAGIDPDATHEPVTGVRRA